MIEAEKETTGTTEEVALSEKAENGPARKPRELRFEEGERKRYPLQWLIALRPLVDADAEIESESKGLVRADDGLGPRGSAPAGIGSRFPARATAPRRTVFPGPGGMDNFQGGKVPSIRTGSLVRPMSQHGQPTNNSVGYQLVRGKNYEEPPPQPVIERGQNAWKPSSEAPGDDVDEVATRAKEIRLILNKITLDTFDKLYEKLLEIEISSVDILKKLVEEIFEKALFEPSFREMYADLCKRLNDDTSKSLAAKKLMMDKKPATVRRALLNYCKDEFESTAIGDSLGDNQQTTDADETAKMSEDDKTIKEMKAKRRKLGNVIFIGELYKKRLLPQRIIVNECINKLLEIALTKKDGDVIECLCKLLTTVGGTLTEEWKGTDQEKQMDQFFYHFIKLSEDRELPSRIRFMLKDLIDARGKNWEARTFVQKPKKIAEVHEEAKKEEELKNQRSYSSNNRDMRPGGGGRKPGGYQLNAPVQNMNRMTSHMNLPTNTNRMSTKSRQQELLTKRSEVTRSYSARDQMSEVSLKPGGGGKLASEGVSLKPGGGGKFPSRGNSTNSIVQERSRSMHTTNNAFGALDRNGTYDGRKPSAPAPKVEKAPQPMAEDLLARRSKNLGDEYLMNKDDAEAIKEALTIPSPQRGDMVRQMLYGFLESSPKKTPDLAGLLHLLTKGDDPPVGEKDFLAGIGGLLELLDDIIIDCSPLGGKLIAQAIARTLVEWQYDLKVALKSMDEKLAEVEAEQRLKFWVHMVAEYAAEKEGKSGESFEENAKSLYNASELDFKSIANAFPDSARGEQKLRDLLVERKLDALSIA